MPVSASCNVLASSLASSLQSMIASKFSVISEGILLHASGKSLRIISNCSPDNLYICCTLEIFCPIDFEISFHDFLSLSLAR